MERRLLPPLSTITGFEAAARKLSHRAAAEELNVTHPAISHQIKNLEEHLGVKLFNRDGRNVVLSEEGEVFYPFVLEALESLSRGVLAVRHAKSALPLKVQTYVTFSIRWLARRLPAFNNQFPECSVQLDTYASRWDFDDENADVGIIYSDITPDEKYHWEPIFNLPVTAVCSPSLVANLSSPLKPRDVLSLPLLSVATEVDYWSRWFAAANLYPQEITPHMVVDTKAMALEMAISGEGIALVNGPFIDDELASGSLIKISEHTPRFEGSWGIICKKEDRKRPDIDSFFSWMKAATSNY